MADVQLKEVPLRYVRANQAGIVLFVILSFVFQQPWLLFVLWVIEAAGLATSGKWNVFVLFARKVLNIDKGTETEALELTRFNNSLAVLFLTLALVSFWALGWTAVGYIFAAGLLIAAGAALAGYCIGCKIYFWVKQIKAGRGFGRA